MRNYDRNSSLDSDSDMSCDEYSTCTFQNSVQIAEREDRLIKGLFESAHVLEMCPEIVERCILPRGISQNISTLIQHKLIEAYCLENDIEIIKVDHEEFHHTFKEQRNKSTDFAPIECVLLTSKSVTAELEMDVMPSLDDEQFG